MKQLTPNDPETKSAELVADNILHLQQIFPEAFTEGNIDFEVLKQLLGGVVDEREEKYGLNWHGKRLARQISLTPSTGTLRPCPEDSIDWKSTQNLLIQGDNLEVLKLLQKAYSGKIKLIYIDPPYNTGRDFVYPDNFHDSIKNYFDQTRQTDESGKKVTSNAESSGRYHTDWLNMIYPRLRLARNLLQDNGAIFVSIADHEIHNLRSALDEIFGPENFIATVIWHKMDSPKNTAIHFSEDHDYIVVYAKHANEWRPNGLERTDEMIARYKNPDSDPRGVWLLSDLAARNFYAQGRYSITTPSGKVITGPPAGSYWRVSKEKFDQLDKDNRIWWGESGENRPGIKRFLSEVRDGVVPQTYWHWKDVGSTRNAKQELSQVMDAESGQDLFITPKPTKLLERILQISTTSSDRDIVLDFFGGSGTTGHAVGIANSKDNGNRRYILVQLPEPTGNPKYPNIADLMIERLRRVQKKIQKDCPMFSGDVGFRVLKLDSSNIRAWDPNRDDLSGSLMDSVEHVKPDRTEQDVLYELLLKLGLELTVPIEEKSIVGKTVHSIGAGTLIACLASVISRTEVEKLALGIVEWHKALAPAGDTTVVFRDNAFSDDVAKTNLTAILEQHGLQNVRSL